MGKEQDSASDVLLRFSGQLSAAALENGVKVGDHVGWMGAVPRTPLRTLIAQESSLSQPTDPKSSPGRTRGEAGSAHAMGRWNSFDGAKAGRRNGSFKLGSPSPSSGCSSPSTFGTHKIRAVCATMPPKPMAESRPVQLGALFAQEREETTRTSSRLAEADGAILVVKDAKQPPLRDLIAAELVAPVRSPSPGKYTMRSTFVRDIDKATKPTVVASDATKSQELRYLFAKDWALQASDEDDEEFWDSGSLCGASPSPRSGRRRPKKQQPNSKLRHSSHSTAGTQQLRSRMNSPCSTSASIASRLQELQRQSTPGHGHQYSSCRFVPSEVMDAPEVVECGHAPKSSSLGTLLAEEIAATSRSFSLEQQPQPVSVVEPTWSAPSESSRRPKIGSLSDISTPVRPESKSQLDFLIAKILTLRANSMEGKKSSEPTMVGEPDDGGCSTSGSTQQASTADMMVRVREEDFFCGAATDSSAAAAADLATGDTDVHNLPTTADAPNSMSPPSPETGEAPEEPHSPSLGELSGETIHNSSINVTDADAGAGAEEATSRHEVTDGYKVGADGEPEAEASAPERVQLGTLLERTRGEHGWLPLGRSRMSSPLIALPAIPQSESDYSDWGMTGNAPIGSQPPASSSTASSRFSTSVAIEISTQTCHHSDFLVPPRSSLPGSPRSAELVDHPTFQQAPETTTTSTTTELASSNSPPSMREQRPATQRVSLLSLLNQDMEMEHEDGLQLEVLCGGEEDDEDEEEKEAETEELDPMCCVCMVGHKGAAFIPCGHTFCRKCCREVRRSLGSCPLCNQAIVDVLRLY